MTRYMHNARLSQRLMRYGSKTVFGLLAILFFASCKRPLPQADDQIARTTYYDTTFWQEYHEAWPISDRAEDNEVRAVAVDSRDNVWAAAKSGVFIKEEDEKQWRSVFSREDNGPAFSVVVGGDSAVWMSTWKGVYRYENGKPRLVEAVTAPVSTLTRTKDGVYALGPHGVWRCSSTRCEKQSYIIARSVRDALEDNTGSLWVATDVGLYRVKNGQLQQHLVTPEYIISAYVRGLSFDRTGNLWAAGLGGVSILKHGEALRKLMPDDGIPSIQVNAVERAPDGRMWVGTDHGVVRYRADYTHSLRFSRRWLLSDKVNDIAFDTNGNAWIATTAGVSAIKRKRMTLASKAAYFYDVLMRRHIRAPWIAGQCKLPNAGDTTVWTPDDDDNDGEYTANYLAMECFRYAATRDPQAKENADKAFAFLQFLGNVTGKEGFFARTIVPADWKEVDDGNRTYTERELADELVKEPRFKPVQVRWHKSDDGAWRWKGDTSSDEMCGHMMGYFFYYELAADEIGRKAVREEVVRIVDHLMANDFNFVDVDGTHTRWGVWSPSKLNRDPEWMPDRSLNSMELLAFTKLAYHVTGDEKYQDAYRRLIREEHYLDNMANIANQNPGWFIYFDVMLAAYEYPILLKCEKDPELLSFYEQHIDQWFERHKHDGNPLINFIYCYSRNKKSALAASSDFLRDTPLDLVDWYIDHTKREDVTLVRQPVLDELQVNTIPPPSIRATIRWDKNPAVAVAGNPHVEREPVFWLLPYWMGRYLDMIVPE